MLTGPNARGQPPTSSTRGMDPLRSERCERSTTRGASAARTSPRLTEPVRTRERVAPGFDLVWRGPPRRRPAACKGSGGCGETAQPGESTPWKDLGCEGHAENLGFDVPPRTRVSIVRLGTVGEWLLRAIDRHSGRLRDDYDTDLSVVALATRRDGFVHRKHGIEIADALALRGAGRSIAELDGADHWPTALAGLEAPETDVLVEVGQSPASDGEPGLAHLRHALRCGVSVATSNKWPVALAGVELRDLARRHGAGFRAESTVMSGTPLLAALTTGLGGATPLRLRGVLNATVNFICSRLMAGGSYEEAVAETQEAGLAEPDPSADLDGFDSVAKSMVLSALVFGVQLTIGEVACRGISQVAEAEIRAARARGRRIKELATLDVDAGRRAVEVSTLMPGDPFFDIEGTANAVRLEVDPLARDRDQRPRCRSEAGRTGRLQRSDRPLARTRG